ncbi:MAG: hypothetical protein IJN02_00425 [Bacteroidales bacterium]|nr:hypothetical protein [Bacteroidales bacterium]
MIWLLAVLSVVFGCKQPEEETPAGKEPALEVTLENITPSSADLLIRTQNIMEVAYVINDHEMDNMTPMVVFKSGITQKASGTDRITVSDLESESDYVVYVAAKVDESTQYDDVVMLEFSTAAYEFTDLVTVIEKDMDSFKVHIKTGDNIGPGQDQNAIRYGVITLPFYLDLLSTGRTDAEALTDNGRMKVTASRELYYGPDNVYVDENLNPVPEDEADPLEHYYLHDYFSPGEPLVFLAGEFEWGEDEFGRGWDHFIPLFDYEAWFAQYIPPTTPLLEVAEMQDQYWSGEFQRTFITLDTPALLDGGVTIEPVSSSAIDASFNVIPDDNVYSYHVGIMDQGIYEDVLKFLGGNEDYLQWFLTSYYAWRFGLAQTYMGGQKINLTNQIYAQPNTTYHVMVTCFGDQGGTVQSFQRTTISTTGYTLPLPDVDVTAVEDGKYSDRVKFNIKAPAGDLVKGFWACNYVREFELLRNVEYTYPDIISGGVALTPAEIAAINSPEGYDIWFTSPPAETWRLGVLGYNAEDRTNTFERGDNSFADCSTRQLDPAVYVKTDLYDKLVGDWTAKARILSVYDENGNTESTETGYKSFEREIESKVTISRGVDYVSPMPESLFDIYKPRVDENGNQIESDEDFRRRVTDVYNGFCTMADDFTKYNVDWQNRLLCTGFALDKYAYGLNVASPWDLFTSSTYGSYDNGQIFYDFGPKWYLEFYKEDGVVKARVPMNTELMYPFSNWDGYNYHLLPYSSEKNETLGSFGYDDGDMPLYGYSPVEISADAQTITLKALIADGAEYYLTPQYFTYGSPSMAYAVVSEIVLTKGWNGDGQQQDAVPGVASLARPRMVDPDNNLMTGIKMMTAPKAITPLKAPVKLNVAYQAPATRETFNRAREEYYSEKIR